MAITKEIKYLKDKISKVEDICSQLSKIKPPKSPSRAPILCLLGLNTCLLITLIVMGVRGL